MKGRIKQLLKKKSTCRIGATVAAITLAVAMVIGLIPAESVIAQTKVSDYKTDTKYTESLGDNASTEYAGRIWSDKSVYSESATFDLYTPEGEAPKSATIEKSQDSEFLVAFSALATSEAVSGQTQAPVDVVFVIDTSGSMAYTMGGQDNTQRIANTIKALNTAIDAVMKMNPYTRVGVVAFADTAAEILPLGRYEKGTRRNGYTTTTDYFSLNDNVIYAHVKREGSTSQTNRNRSVTGGTNIQMGVYNGLNMLNSVQSTTANIEGSVVPRVPAMILLSDGAPTYSSGSDEWWTPANNNDHGPGGSPYVGNGFKALMTGAYMKQRVDAKYNAKTSVYTIGMGISGLSNTSRGDYTGEQDLAYLTLNPGVHWDESNNANAMAAAMADAWDTYTTNNGTPSLRVESGYQGNYEFTHPSTNDIDDLDNNDATINPLKQFVDGYYDADSASEVTDVFDAIVANIAISAPQVPTEMKTTDPMTDGYITYTDPIGQYMEVKEVQEIIYAGTEFKNPQKTTSQDGLTTKYTFTGEVHSPVYGDQEIKNIIIEVTKDANTGNETLTVKVPAAVIPVRVNTVQLNKDGSVQSHTNNGAYPVRVLYSVGLQDGIVKDGIVQMNKLTDEYIKANSNHDGTINFYSNLYDGENTINVLENGQEITKTVGNATVEFEPAHNNSFYYITQDIPLYKNAACTPDDRVTVAEGLDPDATYYYVEKYYHGLEEVRKIVERTGAQLMKTDRVEVDGYLYRAAGSPRPNRIMEFEGKKIDNNTKTADDFYAPTFQYAQGSTDPYAGKYVIYLGNNGVMSVAASGSLEISKKVETAEGLTPATTEFEFSVNFDGNATLAGTYDYEVMDAAGAVLRTAAIADGGTLTLKDGEKAVIYNLPPGTAYEVKETQADTLGFRTVSSGTNGTIVEMTTSLAEFTNIYSVTEVTYPENDLLATKVLDGRVSKGDADTYEFFMTPYNAAYPMPADTTNGSLNKNVTLPTGETTEDVSFGQITFTKPGTYVYAFQETRPTVGLAGMTYSKAVYRLEVVVADDGVGALKVDSAKLYQLLDDAGNIKYTRNQDGTITLPEPLAEGTGIVFTNVYQNDTVATQFSAIKTYTDKSGTNPLKAGMFTFALERVGIVDGDAARPDTASSLPWYEGESGAITRQNNMEVVTFPAITFDNNALTNEDSTITYRYQLTEVVPEGATENKLNGMTYDDTVYYADVTLTWDSTAQELQVDLQYKDADLNPVTNVNFVNEYEPAPAKVTLNGTKTMVGRDMKDGEEFEFVIGVAGNDSFTGYQFRTNMGVTGMDQIMATVSGGAEGQAVAFAFGELECRVPGTYQFVIGENAPNPGAAGVTYDTQRFVTIVVTDDNGQLVADVQYDNGAVSDATDKAVFVNTYEAADTEPISLTGTKVMIGRELRDGEFFFSVEPQNGAPLNARNRLVSATADGNILLLNEVSFSEAGTYEYIFREQIPSTAVNGKLNGITYDTSVYRYVVTVEDDLSGKLIVTDKQLYKNDTPITDDVVFENKYETTPAVREVPAIYKVLDGKRGNALAAGEFEFTMSAAVTELDGSPITGNLADYVTVPANVTNQADGAVEFGNVMFHKTGIYTITVEEVEPATNKAEGVTYSKEKLVGVFRVVDNGLGALEHEMIGLTGHYTFTNTYESKGDFTLTINKNFTGRPENVWLDSDKFQFEVVILDPDTQAALDAGKITFPSDSAGIVKLEVTKDKQSITSDKIEIFEAGTYKFRVHEVAGDILGVKYDSTAHDVVVTATDNSDGTISIQTNVPSNAITFNNVYDTELTELSGHDHLTIEKIFTGRPDNAWLDTDKFTFTLAAGNTETAAAVTAGDVILPDTTLEVSNANKAHPHFGNITFKKVGTYTFTITEEDSPMKGVIDDTDNVRTIIVNVTDGGEGVLVAKLGNASDTLDFTNTYTTDDVDLIGAEDLVVEKVLSGRDWFTADEFAFTLEAYDDVTKEAVGAGNVILPTNAEGITITKANKGADGKYKAHFGNITFKEVGTYQFQIKETAGEDAKLTYDSHSSVITVVVTDNNEGELVAVPSYSGAMQFENTYTPDPVQATLTGMKNLTGRELKSGEFRFHIVAAEGTAADTPVPAVQTVSNAANGTITFPQMTYYRPGVYKYVISEIEGSLAGVEYDKVHVEATVTVNYDSATGILTTVVTYTKGTSGTAFEFHNEYTSEPTDKVNITAEKIVTGNAFAMNGNDFRFELEPAEANPTQDPIQRGFVTNTNSGIIGLFEDATYTQAGTYVYTLHEVDGNRAGITYDDSVYTITVEVTDDEAVAKLSAEVTITKTLNDVTTNVDYIEFKNEYIPTETTAIIHGHKYMDSEHKTLESGEFTFEIAAVTEGAPMPAATQVTNAETGLFQFGAITYTQAGVYEYKVTEVIPGEAVLNGEGKYELNGKTYDDTEHTVTVTVTDIQSGLSSGELIATVEGVVEAGTNKPLVVFTNGYVPNEVTLEGTTALQGTKTLAGRDMKAGEFTFELEAVTLGAPMPANTTAVNKAAGQSSAFVFDQITYTKAGEYLYTIKETRGNKGGVDYDEAVFVAKVTVTDEGYDGQLDAVVTYYKEDAEVELAFENTYEANDTTYRLGIVKKLKGRTLVEGEFEFEIMAHPDTPNAPLPVNKIARNEVDGKVTFDEILYTETGTYSYLISEKNTGAPYIIYDSTLYKVVVEVTDNLEGQLVAQKKIFNAETLKAMESIIFNNRYALPEVVLKKAQFINGKAVDVTAKVAEGDVVTYVMTIQNIGEGKATGLEVMDKAPNGMVFMKDSVEGGDSFQIAEDGTITWKVAVLAAGESRTMSFKASVPKTDGDVNWVNVASAIYENNPENPEPTPENPEPDPTPIPSNEVEVIVEKAPPMGDAAVAWVWAGLAVVSVALGAAVIVVRKREEKQ